MVLISALETSWMSLDAKLDARPWTWWLAAARAQFWHLGRMILVAGSRGKANLVCLVTMIDGACVEAVVSEGWSGSGRFCCKSYNNFLISAPAHAPSCVVCAIDRAHSSSQLLQLLWCCCVTVHQKKPKKKHHQDAAKFMHACVASGRRGQWTQSLFCCVGRWLFYMFVASTLMQGRMKQWNKMAQRGRLAQISLKHLHFMNVSVYLSTLKVYRFTKNLLATHGNPVKSTIWVRFCK